ncbi:hypothetical protein Tco_0280422 [Tanacetum coccineum]
MSDTESDDTIQRKCALKKKRKGNKREDNMMAAYKPEAEAKVVEVKSKTNDRKTINSRMSPRNLKRVLDSLTTSQQKRLKQMGFREFEGNFDFYYVPGKKDGTINERLIPYLEETDKIHQMDWCSYVLESLVKECTGFSASDKFNGPVLLLVLIYVNSTVSKKVMDEKTVPTLKA